MAWRDCNFPYWIHSWHTAYRAPSYRRHSPSHSHTWAPDGGGLFGVQWTGAAVFIRLIALERCGYNNRGYNRSCSQGDNNIRNPNLIRRVWETFWLVCWCYSITKGLIRSQRNNSPALLRVTPNRSLLDHSAQWCYPDMAEESCSTLTGQSQGGPAVPEVYWAQFRTCALLRDAGITAKNKHIAIKIKPLWIKLKVGTGLWHSNQLLTDPTQLFCCKMCRNLLMWLLLMMIGNKLRHTKLNVV